MGTAEEEMKRVEENVQRRQEEALKNPDTLADQKDQVGDLQNLSDAMDRDTSLIEKGSEVLEEEKTQPAAPATQQETPAAGPNTPQPAASATQQETPAAGPNTPQPAAPATQQETPAAGPNTPQPVAAPNVPKHSSHSGIYLDSKAFEGKERSFFNPYTDKGLWQMLDKKIEDILNAKDPQEMMEKAFWAVVDLLFDTINAGLDHHEEKRKNLKKAYDRNIQAYDRERGTKEKDLYIEGLRSIMEQLPEGYQKYNRDGHFHFEEMSSRDKKKLNKLITKKPDFCDAMRNMMSRVAGREIRKDEFKQIVDKYTKNTSSALDLNSVRMTVAQSVQGKPLKDPAIGATVELGGSIRGEAQSVDAETKSYSEKSASQKADRQAYEQARSGGRASPETGHPLVRGRNNEGHAA